MSFIDDCSYRESSRSAKEGLCTEYEKLSKLKTAAEYQVYDHACQRHDVVIASIRGVRYWKLYRLPKEKSQSASILKSERIQVPCSTFSAPVLAPFGCEPVLVVRSSAVTVVTNFDADLVAIAWNRRSKWNWLRRQKRSPLATFRPTS